MMESFMSMRDRNTSHMGESMSASRGLAKKAVRDLAKVSETYDGTSDATVLNSFIRVQERYLAAVAREEQQQISDAEFITHIADRLTKHAAEWWDSLPDSTRPTTKEAFLAELRRKFYPANMQNTVRAKLKKLRLKGSVNDFVKEFMRLVGEVRALERKDVGSEAYTDAEAMRQFLQCLAWSEGHGIDVHNYVMAATTFYHLPESPRPLTLDDYMRAAQLYFNLTWTADKSTDIAKPQPTGAKAKVNAVGAKGQRFTPYGRNAGKGKGVDKGAGGSSSGSSAFGGTCFVCGETGHRALDCLKRAGQSDPKGKGKQPGFRKG